MIPVRAYLVLLLILYSTGTSTTQCLQYYSVLPQNNEKQNKYNEYDKSKTMT